MTAATRRRVSPGGWPVVILLAGCASTQPVATIEPPNSGGPAASSTSPGAAPGGDSGEFVLSRQKPADEKPVSEESLHIGEKWWRFRGNFLKLTEAQVRERDAGLSAREAPATFWDPQTAFETVAIWSGLCNQCHGGRRRQQDALSMPGPAGSWGQGEGLFFGNRRLYAEVFAIVANGGPKREGKMAMPPWRTVLAKEQIWALLYFLEYQSGGIEGRFPPSLYPRMRRETGGQ